MLSPAAADPPATRRAKTSDSQDATLLTSALRITVGRWSVISRLSSSRLGRRWANLLTSAFHDDPQS
jgi:hypothetical protein